MLENKNIVLIVGRPNHVPLLARELEIINFKEKKEIIILKSCSQSKTDISLFAELQIFNDIEKMVENMNKRIDPNFNIKGSKNIVFMDDIDIDKDKIKPISNNGDFNVKKNKPKWLK